jgi:cytochrome P450
MRQGPQTVGEVLNFGVSMVRSQLFMAQGRLQRQPITRFATAAGRRDPYPIHEEYRSLGRIVETTAGFLVTADHELCRQVLRSRKYGVKDPETGIVHGQLYDTGTIDRSMLGVNAPEHTRLRKLAAPGFTPKLMRSYEKTIEERVGSLLDDLHGRETFDLVHEFSAPMPITVIADLLGVPPEDAASFEQSGQWLASALDGIRSPSHAVRLALAARRLEAIFDRLFELRAREPREDLVSALVAARDGGQLTAKELVALCEVLLVAGFETTVNLITNAVLALQRTPGAWDRLVDDPGLAPLAVEETLRFDPPVQRSIRVALEDTELAGRAVPRGTWVITLIGGANRDPEVYDRPAEFVIDRYADKSVPDHLAFSGGIHYCLGAALARLEGATALRTLATRMPGLRLVGEPTMRRSVSVRGAASLTAIPG